MYYIYMLRCQDESIYTGITTDLERRMKEHFDQEKACAKYTKRHLAKKLEMAWETKNRQLASKLEYHLKTLLKIKKEEIICNPILLEKFLKDKIEVQEYEKVKIKEEE